MASSPHLPQRGNIFQPTAATKELPWILAPNCSSTPKGSCKSLSRARRNRLADARAGTSAGGEATNSVCVGERHRRRVELLKLVANVLRGGLALPGAAGVLDCKQKFFGHAVDLAQSADGGNPSVAVSVNLRRCGFIQMERLYCFARLRSLDMHERQNHVVSVIPDFVVLAVEPGQVLFLKELRQAA